MWWTVAAWAMVPAEDQQLGAQAGCDWSALVAGDFDGDGFDDLLARCGQGRWHWARGGQNGLRAPTSTPIAGDQLVLVDSDADGDDDVFELDGNRLSIRQATPGFPAAVGVFPISPSSLGASGDLDGDGYADLIVADTGGVEVSYGSSNGPTLPSALPGVGRPALADGDGDGIDDLFLVLGATIERYRGTPQGPRGVADVVFVHPTAGADLEPEPAGADLDGDGREDLVLWDPARRVHEPLYGRANGVALGAPLPGSPARLGWSFVDDVDGDGDDESWVGLPDGGAQGEGVAAWVAGGNPPVVSAARGAPGSGAGLGVATGDFDADGIVDRATTEGQALAIWYGP